MQPTLDLLEDVEVDAKESHGQQPEPSDGEPAPQRGAAHTPVPPGFAPTLGQLEQTTMEAVAALEAIRSLTVVAAARKVSRRSDAVLSAAATRLFTAASFLRIAQRTWIHWINGFMQERSGLLPVIVLGNSEPSTHDGVATMAVYLGGSLAAVLGAPNCKVQPPVGEPYIELRVAALAIGHCLASKSAPTPADIKKIRRWVRGELGRIWAPKRRLESIDDLQHMLRGEYDMARAVLTRQEVPASGAVSATTVPEWMQLTPLQQAIIQWMLSLPHGANPLQREILEQAGGDRDDRDDRRQLNELVGERRFLLKLGKRNGYRLHRVPRGTPAKYRTGSGWAEHEEAAPSGD